MGLFDKLSKAYAKANPFVKYLTITSLISSAITISTDIGNIISTLISKPERVYEEPKHELLDFCSGIETFQKTI